MNTPLEKMIKMSLITVFVCLTALTAEEIDQSVIDADTRAIKERIAADREMDKQREIERIDQQIMTLQQEYTGDDRAQERKDAQISMLERMREATQNR